VSRGIALFIRCVGYHRGHRGPGRPLADPRLPEEGAMRRRNQRRQSVADEVRRAAWLPGGQLSRLDQQQPRQLVENAG